MIRTNTRTMRLHAKVRFAMLVSLTMLLAMTRAWADEIKRDERVVFFPTYASADATSDTDGQWRVHFHGWIFEPEENSRKRAAAMALFRKSIGIEGDTAESQVLRKRAMAFLVDNERGKEVAVRLGHADAEPEPEPVVVEASDANGHFTAVHTLDTAAVKALTHQAGDKALLKEVAAHWVTFRAVMRDGDDRQFVGRVQFIPATGVSVISDIDDTIKVSNVASKNELLRNSFTRDFKAVEGMAAVYRDWAARGAVFHYVTAGPWQLYEPMNEWMRADQFPDGSMHMKTFRWKDSTFFDLFANSGKIKQPMVEQIVSDFPQRRFILIGDSGEADATIYGEIARAHPDRVLGIYIRNTHSASREDAVYQKAFTDVPDNKWVLFDDASELMSLKWSVDQALANPSTSGK